MGIVELLAALALKPNQHPTERRATIELGNELLRKVGSASDCRIFLTGLTVFQIAETKLATSTNRRAFRGSLSYTGRT
jgi:hypothetical protein